MKENDLDIEFLEKVYQKNDSSLLDQTKCFGLCLMEKENYLDDSKHIKLDEFRERLTPMYKMDGKDKVEEIIAMCPEIHEEMTCETARNFEKCIAELM